MKNGQLRKGKYVLKLKHHYINASEMGSYARFINHSSTPNAEFVKKEVNKVERCAIYTMKDIDYGDEITCLYSEEQVDWEKE